MQIFNPVGDVIFDGGVGDQSHRYKSLMSDNTLTIYIATDNYIEFPIGSYVYFQRDESFSGEYYFLLKPQNLTKIHTENWEYEILFESEQYLLRTRQFKFFTVNNESAPDKPYKLKGWYTATAYEWLEMLVRNMNDGDTGWTIGNYIESERILLEYSGENCLAFLQKVADALKTEWYIIGKQMSLGKVGRTDITPIPLSYGYGNGLKSGVKRDIGDKEKINRMYVIGGERNIYKSKYGSSTLLLPKNHQIKYDGRFFEDEDGYNPLLAIEYTSDSNGMYLERSDKDHLELLNEGLYENTDIYPMRESTVTEVIAVNDSKALYDIKDNHNIVNYNDYWADQEKPTIVFHSGMLNAKEFEISKYSHTEKRFELVPITDADVNMPQGSFIPAIGDKYAVFNIYIPTEDIEDAEMKLLKSAVKSFHEESMQEFVITCELSNRYSQENWTDIGDKLDIGYFVNFSDANFMPEPQVIRIIGVKDYVNRPKKPILELSNEVRVNSWSSLKAEIRDSQTVTERINQGNLAQTKRMWRNLEETQQAMYDPEGDFFTKLIQPLAIQTMQLIAGTKSLQFGFLDRTNHAVKSDLPTPEYNVVDKSLSIAPRALKHYTLDINDITPEANRTYKIWDIDNKTFILEPDKLYYIYAKCEKGTTVGEYVASLTPIELEQIGGHYHFWIGLSHPKFDNVRSWKTMYGFTEVLSGQITTDRIVSADGNNIFDLINSILNITNGLTGDAERTLSWNGTELSVTNAVVKKALKVDGNAIIAGFKFYNDRIESVKTITHNGNTYPAVVIVGNNTLGYVELNSLISRWSSSGGMETVLQTIKLDSDSGIISVRSSDGNVSQITSQGIFSNRAGMDALPASSGVELKAGIIGLGYGEMSKSVWGDKWGMVGVYGTASNTATTPAPAYGGWFDSLKANGFIPSLIKLHTSSAASISLDKQTTVVSCSSTDQKTIYLPADAYEGTVIWFKQWDSGKMRIYPPYGHKLFDDDTENSYIDITNGQAAMIMFIGSVNIGGSVYNVWLLSKMTI